MKKRLITLLQILVPAGILAYLLWTFASDPENIAAARQIFSGKTHWLSVGFAFLCSLAALSLTFIRWYLLVISVGIPFQMKDAFRLGFLGYMLNFVGLGGVGGDLFKGYVLAKENPDKRPEAVSTIFMDRAIGLYALFAVTSLAALGLDWEGAKPAIQTMVYVVYGVTLAGIFALAIMCLPGFRRGAFREFLESLPKVGKIFQRGFLAFGMYRRRPKYLAIIAVLSLGVHVLFSVAAYFLATAMFDKYPSLLEMTIITPLAMVFAAIPISPGGMGTMELAITELYTSVPSEQLSKANAITVALGFRVLTIALAFIGAMFYWTNRATLDKTMAEASAEEDPLEPQDEARELSGELEPR